MKRARAISNERKERESCESYVYATLTLNRRVVRPRKLQGPKIHSNPQAPTAHSHSLEGDNITAARKCVRLSASFRRRQSEIKLRCIGAKCKQVPLSRIESSAAAPPLPSYVFSLFPRRSLQEEGEGSPNFCPAVYLDCPFGRITKFSGRRVRFDARRR